MEEETFDLIFADAMPGKYEHIDLAWKALSNGGFHVIDDMLPQDNFVRMGMKPMSSDCYRKSRAERIVSS